MTQRYEYIQKMSNFYCFCSEASYASLLARQKACPLEFSAFLTQYTKCYSGCGSCIDSLYLYLSETNSMVHVDE